MIKQLKTKGKMRQRSLFVDEVVSTSSMDKSYMRSRVRTRTHGSVGRREPRLAPSDPMVC